MASYSASWLSGWDIAQHSRVLGVGGQAMASAHAIFPTDKFVSVGAKNPNFGVTVVVDTRRPWCSGPASRTLAVIGPAQMEADHMRHFFLSMVGLS